MHRLLTEEKKLCQSLVCSFNIALEYKNKSNISDYMNRSELLQNEIVSNNPQILNRTMDVTFKLKS